MSTKLGSKLRAFRRREGMTQTDLAAKLDISPSYLNLIEHNQRPLPAHLLVRSAQLFKADLEEFADDSSSRLAADLQEVFGDPIFEEHPLTTNDLREVADNAAAARAILSLYHAYRGTIEQVRALHAKVFDGRDFAGLDPAHLPSEEVSDVIQNHMNFFPELEAAAQSLDIELDRGDVYRSLVQYLRDRLGIHVIVAPVSVTRGAVRRFDPDSRTLTLSEMIPQTSRNFQVAHQIGLLTAGATIDSIIARAQKNLTTPDSVKLCRVALASYFAGALLMPYDDFLRSAEEMRYDIEMLEHRYDVSFEQVCHRLTTLRKPNATGISFHFVRVDVAGNISKRFSGTGIRFARFSGSCPRWDVHAAFLTPEIGRASCRERV